jgi:hypothetical protein
MRCYYVLVHGKLDWTAPHPDDPGELARPAGFYSHRYVLAQTEADATEKAFRRVRKKLDERADWLREGLARLTLEVEELAASPLHKLLQSDPGNVFY